MWLSECSSQLRLWLSNLDRLKEWYQWLLVVDKFEKQGIGFIAEKYLALVDGLYDGKTEQFIETVVKFEDGRTGSVSATLKLTDATIYAPVKAAA